MKEVAEFYDAFAKKQCAMGINNRHLSIRRWLEEVGLKPYHEVLEIGCGIGTVTELILQHLNKDGFLRAVDISPESIDTATSRLRKYRNVDLMVKDITATDIRGAYDVIVLPDVIEHIPISLHAKLFKNISKALNKNGFVFIHMPDPNYLEWVTRNNPAELQVIDQPIHAHILSDNLIKTGLYVHYLSSYTVYDKQPDYQVVVLKKIPLNSEYGKRKKFLIDSITRRINLKFRYFLRGGR